MAQIYFKGNSNPVSIPNERAAEVKQDILTGQVNKAVYELGTITINGSEIKAVVLDQEIKESIKRFPTDYTTAELKEIAGDIGEKLARWEKEELEKPLKYYGEVVREDSPVYQPRIVHNPIMGFIDAGIIQGMLREKIIKFTPPYYWQILYDKLPNPDPNAYWELFNRQFKAFKEIESRKYYAQKQEEEAFKDLVVW